MKSRTPYAFIGKDQNWANEQTIYWFDVAGETYGVSDISGNRTIVDRDGYPVNTGDAKNAHLLNLADAIPPEGLQP